MRRLYRIITMPTFNFFKTSAELGQYKHIGKDNSAESENLDDSKNSDIILQMDDCATALKRSIQSVRLRDLYMSFSNLSSELKLSDFVTG